MRDRDSEPRMYKFDPRGEPPETAFRAIAIDQLDETLADLDRPDRAHRSVVHEARRRCKKLRGLLRLVRPGFADFDRENTAIRDAAALLSHLRDSEVMHETFHELSEWRHDPLFERLAAAARQMRHGHAELPCIGLQRLVAAEIGLDARHEALDQGDPAVGRRPERARHLASRAGKPGRQQGRMG